MTVVEQTARRIAQAIRKKWSIIANTKFEAGEEQIAEVVLQVLREQELQRIREFASQHDLELVARIRDAAEPGAPDRFYAFFEDCEVKEGLILSTVCGNGATPEQAILDYADYIRGRLIVKDAMGQRQEFYAHIYPGGK